MVLSATNDSLASEQERISLVWAVLSSHVLRKKISKSHIKATEIATVKVSLTERIGKSTTAETVPTKKARVSR